MAATDNGGRFSLSRLPFSFFRPKKAGVFLGPAHCARNTSCVERSRINARWYGIDGRRGGSISKERWRDSNNLPESSPSATNSIRLAIQPQTGHAGGHLMTDLSLSDAVRVTLFICARATRMYVVWSSRACTSRWKMSAGVTGIRIRGNTSRKSTRLGHRSCRSCLLMDARKSSTCPLSPFSLSLSLFVFYIKKKIERNVELSVSDLNVILNAIPARGKTIQKALVRTSYVRIAFRTFRRYEHRINHKAGEK